MRLGLASRIALLTATVVALTAIGASVVGISQTSREINDDIDRFLRNRTAEILDGIRDRPDGRNGRGDGPDEQQLTGATDNDAEVQTVDRDGNILASAGKELPVGRRDLDLAKEPGRQIIRTVKVGGADYRVATTHVDGGGALQVGRSLRSTNDLLASIRNRLLLIGLSVAAIAGLLGWLFASRAMRPLASLTKSVETVAQTQDLSTRVGNGRHDEVGRLARGFDDMLGALSKSQEQQRRLVQDAAHEFRTPLTSVNANIDLLAHAKDLDPETRTEVIGGVRAELRQLNTLFTEIIELATDEHDRASHQPVNLMSIAEAAAVRQRARTSNPIEVLGAAGFVMGDPVGLERAIANLISNAVKYSPTSAPVTITIDGGQVLVTDQGPGIPEADQRQIFERFYRSDAARAQPGSGLGLAIVDKIVTDHGGSTLVDSTVGQGATVGFTLPTPDTDAPSPKPIGT